MRYILTVVEQLDRAARELRTDHPIDNRLALILVDNATELILHRQCTDHLKTDNLLPTLQPKQRSMAKGDSLRGKLKVLEQLGDLSNSERRFIGNAHQYRNELYHTGLKHDDIIRAIVGCYFSLCCDLLERLKPFPFSYSISSSDTYTDVAKRYLPISNDKIEFSGVDLGALAAKLRSSIPVGIPVLSKVLANSARESIRETEDAFAFVTQKTSLDVGADEILRIAQWQLDLTKALEKKDVRGLRNDRSYQEKVSQVADELNANWKQRHTSLPTEKWAYRADAVEHEIDPFASMELYQSLRNDMSYLEEAILTIEAEVDMEIQWEIDRARGK